MTYLTLIILIGTSLLGATAGAMGTFAVLRRRALTGDLLSHAALPGLCLAFVIIGQRHFLGMVGGALVTGLAAIGLIMLFTRWTRTRDDAALGIVLSTFFGAGIMLLSVIQRQPTGSKAGLDSYIYGQVAGMIRQDVYLIAAVSAVTLLVVVVLYKEFKLLSFDPEFARAQGWPTLALDVAMMGTLALVTVVGLQAAGVVLMAALLIIPGAAARFWTHRLGRMLVLAALFGAGAGALGTLLSAGVIQETLAWDPLAFGPTSDPLPPGPLIVLAGTTVFLASLLFAPRQGLVARVLGELRLRSKVAAENLLRTMYELSEPRLPERPVLKPSEIHRQRALSPAWFRWVIRQAGRLGWLEREAGGLRLSERGLRRAAQLVRAHRLWELFLIYGADIAPDHVHRDADAIEHLLTPEMIRELETRLAAAGELPVDLAVPGSPHGNTESTTNPERPRG